MITNVLLVVSTMVAVACLILMRKKFEYFVICSLALISLSGLLRSYDSIDFLFSYINSEEYKKHVQHLTESEFKSQVHGNVNLTGVGNVFLTNFHWIFALQYYRASSILVTLLSNKKNEEKIL